MWSKRKGGRVRLRERERERERERDRTDGRVDRDGETARQLD